MRIDIYSDVICPWCFIGKRRLERALAERPGLEAAFHWRAFQLNPDMPAQGMDRQLYLQLKFGSAASAERVYREIKAVGDKEDLAFAFEDIRRTPNTVDCHRLIRFAGGKGDKAQDAVVEALFNAYFLEARDIGDAEVLIETAAAAGLNPEEARAFLVSGAQAEAIRAEDSSARSAGINGVPCFIFNRHHALAGAHPPEVLFQIFDLIKQEETSAGAEA